MKINTNQKINNNRSLKYNDKKLFLPDIMSRKNNSFKYT